MSTVHFQSLLEDNWTVLNGVHGPVGNPMEEGCHGAPMAASGSPDYWVRSLTLAAHVCVPAVRVIGFSSIPFPVHFTRRLD